MICGGIGGVALWVAIFPSDVIKSRVQIGLSGIDPNSSFLSILMKISREEGQMIFFWLNFSDEVKKSLLSLQGVRALYKGLGPTILRTFPATGGLFLAYESTKKYLGMTADWIGVVQADRWSISDLIALANPQISSFLSLIVQLCLLKNFRLHLLFLFCFKCH